MRSHIEAVAFDTAQEYRVTVIDSTARKRAKDELQKAHDELERAHILKVLLKTGWRIEGEKEAALLLGLNPSTLRARMRKYGIRRQ